MAVAVSTTTRDRSDAGSEFTEKVVFINRVAKVVSGGRRFSFSAVVVVGDGKGRVGAGVGKAREVPEAIRKGVAIAKRNLVEVPMAGTTIPHEFIANYGAAKVLMKPASPGTGVIAGGGVRAVMELAGIRDILTKSLGSNNPINVVRAALLGLASLRDPKAELRRRGLQPAEDEASVEVTTDEAEAAVVAAEETPAESEPDPEPEPETAAAESS